MKSPLCAVAGFILRHWLVTALATSAAMLAVAHAFQTFGGLQPCHLCLQQRLVYWIALGVTLIGLGFSRTPIGTRWSFVFGWLLALVFGTGTAIAVRHAGAEWKWWPAPQSCSGVGAASAADLQRLLSGATFAPPRCDVAPWRFLGLSMAGWNALISLKLTGWSLAFGLRRG
ncbi:MAG: disulfide bond formation protein B [Caulobacteraceae bacterium]|nr:disulfide bond formation protein B [Caulobacteraceae bacterium]